MMTGSHITEFHAHKYDKLDPPELLNKQGTKYTRIV